MSLAARVRSVMRRFRWAAAPAQRPSSPTALIEEGILTIGRHSYGFPRVHVWRKPEGTAVGGRVIIGSFVSIADDVEIFTGGNHRMDWISTYPFRVKLELPGAWEDGHPDSRGDVVIGHDVWIGMGAKILSGVHVGNGAVIGAYAVVTRDVRPYAVLAGNPAHELRRRFADEHVAALEELAWWEWPDERLLSAVPGLCTPDIEAFLDEWSPPDRPAARPDARITAGETDDYAPQGA